MREEQISDALNYLDDDIIEEADAVRQNKGKPQKKRRIWFPLASCFVLIFISGYALGKFNRSKMFEGVNENAVEKEMESKQSADSTADDIVENSSAVQEEARQTLTESKPAQKNSIAIIKGTVTSLSTVYTTEADSKTKCLVAEVKIESVYSGDCQENETITVLVPSTDLQVVWMEKENITAAIEIGTTGVFAITESDNTIADFEFTEMNEEIYTTINNNN